MDDILFHLGGIFRRVREVLATRADGFLDLRGVNAKGDRQKAFDVLVDRTIRDYITNVFGDSAAIVSEESRDHQTVSAPQYRFVVDPVDGSDNFTRDFPIFRVSIAVLPGDAPLSIDSVVYGMVGDPLRNRICLAERGCGAFVGDQPLRTSRVTRLENAFISCEMNHFTIGPQAAGVLARGAGVRCFGCTSAALALIAEGKLDVHLDLRGRLTPENYLAGALLVREAGGTVTSPNGRPLAPADNLVHRTDLVASANPGIHDRVLTELNGGSNGGK